jgi:H+-transporting ATPase
VLFRSLTTDNVRPSAAPNAWRIGSLTIAGIVIGIAELGFCAAILVFGIYRMGFGIETLQTLTFIVIVFGNQATTYTNRGRPRLWSTRPSIWLAVSSIADIAIAAILATGGILMKPLPIAVVLGTLGAAAIFAFVLELVKIPIFRRLRIG